MRYTALAPLYDRIMGHVEYGRWLDLIRQVARRYLGTMAPSVFEIGGGTGKLGLLLRQAGIGHTGSDLSFRMCRQAAARGLCFAVADGRRLPVRAFFDMVVFLYDGINYLRAIDDYRQLFAEVHAVLRPGGVFLFDITTKANSERHFLDYLESDDYGDSFYLRHSYFIERTMQQHNDFTIFHRTAGGQWEKHVERHEQRIYTPQQILAAVPFPLFRVAGVWDGFGMQRSHGRSERIHFLLVKQGGR